MEISLDEFVKNPCHYETGDAFEPPYMERINLNDKKIQERTGPIVQPNGDILFRFYAPNAKMIKIIFSGSHVRDTKAYTITLEKKENGFFEGVLPFVYNDVGTRDFSIEIDGARVITPYAPVYHRSGHISNYISIPDTDFDLDYIKKDVPQGTIAYRTYWSTTYEGWKRCLVYLPAEYYHNPEKKYPVLWLNDGGSENETTWTYAGRVHHILDNLIYEGKAVPMIVLMCNTMARRPEEEGTQKLYSWRDNILNDCMPFIENEYRCLTDKWHRAMSGNSLGSMATGFMGFKHPELFGNLGFIAGSIRCHDWLPEFDDNEQIQWMVDNGDEVGRQYKVLFISRGEGEYRSNVYAPDDDQWLFKQGIIKQNCFHIRYFAPDWCHDWSTFRRGLAEFVQLIFKDKNGRY